MEAGNNDDRVRPIPLEGDDALQTEAPAERAVIERTSRPWLPLSIAVAAVVVVVGSVSIFGALRFDDPEPSDPDLFSANTTDDDGSTTTASTLPPPLEELLPGITDRLTLVAESAEDDSAWTLLWDPTFRVPKAVELGIESTPQSRLVAARFDSSGRQVAVQKCGDLACDLYVGIPTDVGAQADVVDTVGFAWHAAEIGRLAWVEAAPSGNYRLVTGTANPLSKEVDEVTVRFELDEPFRIVRWDARGFVIGYFIDDVATAGVAQDGTLQWAIDGAASTATDDLVAAVVVEPLVAAVANEEATLAQHLFVAVNEIDHRAGGAEVVLAALLITVDSSESAQLL